MTALKIIEVLAKLVQENGKDLDVICLGKRGEMRYVESVEVASDVFENVIAIKI